jgi:hypothetical protein
MPKSKESLHFDPFNEEDDELSDIEGDLRLFLDEKKSKINDPVKSMKRWLSRFLDPTFVLAFGTAIFYIIISEYYVSYFQRLSIPFQTLDLPLTFYLSAGKDFLYVIIAFANIVVFSEVIMMFYMIHRKRQEPCALF